MSPNSQAMPAVADHHDSSSEDQDEATEVHAVQTKKKMQSSRNSTSKPTGKPDYKIVCIYWQY